MSTLVRIARAGAAGAALLLAAASQAAPDFSAVPAGPYQVDDAHGYITFSYTHLGFSRPTLRFGAFDVNLSLDKDDVTASDLEVVIDAASIDSGVERFDGHLKGEDFFDTERFPTITFVASSIAPGDDGDTLAVTGDLTIRDVTREVTLLARVNRAAVNPINEKPTIGVSARTQVKRSDFGLDKYVPAVSDEVVIQIDAELQAQ